MAYSPQVQPDIAFSTTAVLADAAVYASGVLSLEGRTHPMVSGQVWQSGQYLRISHG